MIGVLALAVLISSSVQAAEPELHVAAAANLTRTLADVADAFEKSAHIHIVPSYGATAQLAQQIQNGAPFDVFLAADTTHVQQLMSSGAGAPGSYAIYGRGRLVVWAPKRPDFRKLSDIAGANVLGIIIANPALAPYGAASVEAMKNAGLWEALQKKNIVYMPNISAAKEAVDTGNGDAAFTAFSLIIDQPGNYFLVYEKLYQPIDQALCIVKDTKNIDAARKFTSWLTSSAGYEILRRWGYAKPGPK